MHEETKIEMKLEEETKPIKKICEKVMDIVSAEFEKGAENVDTKEMGEAIDILKDLYESKEKIAKCFYYTYILSAMEKEETEEEEAKKIMEKMREEYGDEDEDMERRFYRGQPRSRTTGRYMRRGDGRRSNGGRRSYMEMMMPEMYDYGDEFYRDIDREKLGRLYYSDGGRGGNSMSGGNSGNRSSEGNSSSSSSRGYEEGIRDGEENGYRRGYQEGERNGRMSGRESQSRYDRAKRGFEETKSMHKSNTAEDKQLTMKEMEKVLNVVFDEIDEMLEDSTPEMKSMVKAKGMARFQKIQ